MGRRSLMSPLHCTQRNCWVMLIRRSRPWLPASHADPVNPRLRAPQLHRREPVDALGSGEPPPPAPSTRQQEWLRPYPVTPRPGTAKRFAPATCAETRPLAIISPAHPGATRGGGTPRRNPGAGPLPAGPGSVVSCSPLTTLPSGNSAVPRRSVDHRTEVVLELGRPHVRAINENRPSLAVHSCPLVSVGPSYCAQNTSGTRTTHRTHSHAPADPEHDTTSSGARHARGQP